MARDKEIQLPPGNIWRYAEINTVLNPNNYRRVVERPEGRLREVALGIHDIYVVDYWKVGPMLFADRRFAVVFTHPDREEIYRNESSSRWPNFIKSGSTSTWYPENRRGLNPELLEPKLKGTKYAPFTAYAGQNILAVSKRRWILPPVETRYVQSGVGYIDVMVTKKLQDGHEGELLDLFEVAAKK